MSDCARERVQRPSGGVVLEVCNWRLVIISKTCSVDFSWPTEYQASQNVSDFPQFGRSILSAKARKMICLLLNPPIQQ